MTEPRPGRGGSVDRGAAAGVEGPHGGPGPGFGQGAQVGDSDDVVGEGGFAEGGAAMTPPP